MRALLDADEPTPEGALSAEDWAAHWGASMTATWRMVKRLVDGGHWERVEARQRDARGRLYPRAFYRPRP